MSEPSGELVPTDMEGPTSRSGRMLDSAITKAVSVQQPAVDAYIARVRRSRPDATPTEMVNALSKYYLATVSTTGGAAGAAAFAPNGVSVGAALLDFAAFTEASTLYALAIAEVHGVPVHDLERRRTLVMGILLGNAGNKFIEKAAPRTAAHWGKALATGIPATTISRINKVLGHNFVTRYGTRQGIVVIGKQAPLGIGAVLGASGNAFFGYGVVKSARRAFGPPPASWPVSAAEDGRAP